MEELGSHGLSSLIVSVGRVWAEAVHRPPFQNLPVLVAIWEERAACDGEGGGVLLDSSSHLPCLDSTFPLAFWKQLFGGDGGAGSSHSSEGPRPSV